MTLEQLEAKREEIIQRIGIAQASFGERSVQYADARNSLELIDEQISKISTSRDGPSNYATTYAIFRK